MEVATTTTEAHLSAIHQSLLQISATLGRMLTYGCVNATSSPDAVVPAKCSTVGLNPNIGAVEVVDSSQQPGIVSTVNPGLVGAPSSSTMQQFGILKSGKHTPTTCSTGVLDVDTDAKTAKRDAGTLQAGLSVHVPWDPGVCNDAYSICQEKTGSHLQGVRGCVLYVWALANQLKELQLLLQCIPIEIDQPCSLVIWSITISWDPGILEQIVRQASRPRKLDVQGVMFLHTIMLQQKLGDWCDPGMTFPMCSSFSGIGTTSTCLVFVQLTHMSAAVYSTTGNMLADPREAGATCEIPLPRAPPDIVEISDDCIRNLVMLSVIAMSWDPGVNNQQIMCTHQELEREIDKSTRVDHVIAGLELVFMKIPSEEGKLQQIVSKDMENYVSQWTLLLPQGWQDVQMIIQPTSSKTIELIFSQQLDFRSTTLTFPWDPGNWLWVLQLITSAQFLCLANLSCWSAHSSISWCDMRVWLNLSLYAPEQSTCFRSFPVYMLHLHSGGSGILLGAIEQWNEALKARHAYVMEDPLKTLVTVTWLHTYCSVFCDIHREGWERKLQWLPWNLSVHNQVIRQGQQELCKCYYLCSLIHMANHLQYKQWDPGVTWIVGAEGIKLCSTQPRGTTDRISWLRRRFLCRSWSCSLLRPDLGIAWGQAMFLGGGIVTTTPRAWSLWALGQPCLAVMDASGVYRGEEVHREGEEETEQNRPRSASLFPVPVRLVPSLVSLRSGGYHKPQYPSAHAAIPSPATGVTG